MKKTDIPQDPSPLDKFTREVCYAVNERGEYVTGLSRGWQVKADALGITLNDVQERVADARQKIAAGKASPLLFFMEANMMDVPMVAAYTGFWRWTVRRHLQPQVFKNLSDKKLQRYAEVFKVPVDELKNFK